MEKNFVYYKFDDIIIDDTRHATKIKTSEYCNVGNYPIIDQGQNYISGYTNYDKGLYTDIPSIIFGDHTRIFKYIDTPFFIGADGVKVLKCKMESVNCKYLYYFFLNAKIPNTGYNRHFKWLKDLIIPIPNIEMQNKLVDILDKAQYLIDKRRQQIEQCDELIKSQFVEMFRNKGFSKVTLKDISKKITDGTHKTPTYQSEGITFISAKNIVNGKLDFSDVKYISDSEYEEIQRRCQTEKGDILLSKSGSLGTPVIVETEEKLGLFESLAVIKADWNKVNNIFLCEQFKSDEIQRQFKLGTKGVAIKHLHLNVIGNISIIMPPVVLQNEFATFVQHVNKLKYSLQHSLTELENNFNAFMQKSFNGELFND